MSLSEPEGMRQAGSSLAIGFTWKADQSKSSHCTTGSDRGPPTQEVLRRLRFLALRVRAAWTALPIHSASLPCYLPHSTGIGEAAPPPQGQAGLGSYQEQGWFWVFFHSLRGCWGILDQYPFRPMCMQPLTQQRTVRLFLTPKKYVSLLGVCGDGAQGKLGL